jgi:hypothetical protein
MVLDFDMCNYFCYHKLLLFRQKVAQFLTTYFLTIYRNKYIYNIGNLWVATFCLLFFKMSKIDFYKKEWMKKMKIKDYNL